MVKPPTLNVSVDAQEPLTVTTASLRAFLEAHPSGASDVMKVMDLRPAEEFAAFHIPGSINMSFQAEMPLDMLVAELQERLLRKGATAADHPIDAPYPSFLLVSLQSPDVDDLVCRELMQEYERTVGQAPPANAVGILVGGIAGYRELCP